MFTSLLFATATPPIASDPQAAIWQDLHLGQLFTSVCADRGGNEPALLPYCYQPLTTGALVKLRQQIFRDLTQPEILQAVDRFVGRMQLMARRREKLPHLDPEPYQQEQFLRLVQTEQQALRDFVTQLAQLPIQSAGLLTFRQELQAYLAAAATQTLQTDIDHLGQTLTKISYRSEFQGRHVLIKAQPAPAPTFAATFTACFQGLFADPTAIAAPVAKLDRPGSDFDLDNLQSSILLRLQHLYRTEFQELATFAQRYQGYLVPGLAQAVQELQFYLVWAKMIQRLTQAGLRFCRPQIITSGTELVQGSFDWDLAVHLQHLGHLERLVTNDYRLPADQSFLVISGPNQGGKTTYARMVGEDYYLMALGLPIPGTAASLKLKPVVLTHFERAEQANKISGLLATDVERMHGIIAETTADSFVIMNELFSSTTAADGQRLADKVLDLLQARHASGIYITFLTALGDHAGVVPMMSQVAQGTTTRTYQVLPQALDGQSYATTLLQAYHLRAVDLEGRLSQ
ncbi:hypothetical protein ACFQHW_11735 [Lapidilactobacillus achengensis]|uniref:DNA mismatch repair proteins mutS family domain-containing protein n=1 Tax=Lapidilactobacillus achengensis TaxID=2486000 RepID=A0ABW1UTJ3_9LACO|nr:hypothetical protein [Lapidilactobacillus achengensis]